MDAVRHEGSKGKRRRREDDYDVDDPFVDDSELQAGLQEVRRMGVATKHAGFYVHNDDALETVGPARCGRVGGGPSRGTRAGGGKGVGAGHAS
jgi:hypothetical protein